MTALHLATPDDLDRLTARAAAFHEETGFPVDDAHRHAAFAPVLSGDQPGAIYLAGPARAPLGFAALSFGWSYERAGPEGRIDELYIRPSVRGRGIGTEILLTLRKSLAGASLTALHLEVARDSPRHLEFYQRARFAPEERLIRMTLPLS